MKVKIKRVRFRILLINIHVYAIYKMLITKNYQVPMKIKMCNICNLTNTYRMFSNNKSRTRLNFHVWLIKFHLPRKKRNKNKI